jgi:hypothetical protein
MNSGQEKMRIRTRRVSHALKLRPLTPIEETNEEDDEYDEDHT